VIHYHGGPITPATAAIKLWTARHAFVSFAHPQQMELAAEVTQSFALDNGAFSFWKVSKKTDWDAYYDWVNQWRRHPGFDFAVIPDVIEGTEDENDLLAEKWPFPKHQGAVVWHTNESLDRLMRLARSWPLVAIGSSGEHDVSSPNKFLAHAKNAISMICDPGGYPICKLHGLRMLNHKIFSQLPLSSADSTNVAINIGRDKNWRGTYVPKGKELRASILAERIESYNGASRLEMEDDLAELLG
jgi:hypothetical protein